MINFDDYVNENKTEHNKNWTCVPDHPYRILTIGGSRSGKSNVLLSLIESQSDIDKIYLSAKDPYEAKYQYLINICEKVGLKRFNDTKAFIEYSNGMHDVYKNINYYNRHKAYKILIVFDDMIVDMIRNKKLNSIVTELFIRKKIKYFSCFYHTTYFEVPKDVRLNTAHFFITKIPNKRELPQIAMNHSSALRILKISIENAHLNHILFLLMILHLHLIIL